MEDPDAGEAGEDKHIHQSHTDSMGSAPAPATSVIAHHESAPPDANDQPHTSRSSTIILQWLTYAFWGWTVATLSALTAVVFERLIAGQSESTFAYYVIAAIIVLLPVSFICDMIYSKNEPDRKVGPSSLVMVIHAVIFALFSIGSLLFVAWSVVTLLTDKSDHSSTVAGLLSALVIFVFYAATFMRTLNPSHISWIAKAFRFTMLGVIAVFVILGFTKPTFNSKAAAANDSSYSGTSNNSSDSSDGKLKPAVVGGTQCDIPTLSDGSTTGQVALAGGATCDEAEANIQSADGKAGGGYSANGWTCTSTRQGSGTQWSSYWNDDFYSYNCSSGSKQVAFNLQTVAQSKSSTSTSY